MSAIQFEGLEQAQKAAVANMPPRFLRLQALESWTNGTQYEGRADWWSGKKGDTIVPLWERKPCVRYPAVLIAIQSNSDLVLGEGRFPGATTKPEEDEDDGDDEDSQAASADTDTADNGLSEEDSDVVDRFLREYQKISRFRAHCRESFESAQGQSSAAAIHGHRNGVPFNELIPAKWCTPTLAPDGSCLALEIRYPFFEEYRNADGKWAVRCKLYRRTIDALNDITYKPADANDKGIEPRWIADTTIPHGLGFCPVIWYPFMKGSGPFNQIDGHAIHAGFEDQAQALDIALSQKHRCDLLSEPQPYEIGVTQGYNPTSALGRTAMVPSTEHGGPTPGGAGYTGGDPGKPTGEYMYGNASQPARMKGPGMVWQYPDKETTVGVLTYPDGVLKGMQDHCDDLLQKLEESLAVVFPKPGQFKGTGVVSGRAIEQSKQRQYDRCDKYRDDFGDRFIKPSCDMQLRIALKAREQLRVPGIKQALPILDRFDQPAANADAVAAA